MVLHRYLAALVVFALIGPLPGHAAPLYTVNFLPDADVDFVPAAMNNAGQIAGFVSTPGGSHAAVYSSAGLTDLGLGADAMSVASAINDAGAVTGRFTSNGELHGFLYQNGQLADIGANTSGWGINAHGDVVGARYTDLGTFGFVYSAGALTQLPNLGTGRIGVAVDINDQGDIAGWSITNYDSSPPPLHPYLYRGGALTDLGGLGDSIETAAAAINNAGQIAGTGKIVDADHVFLYEGGVMKDLGSFGGNNLGVADLNEHGTLIGNASTGAGVTVPFMNIGAGLVDLNTLIDPTLGWSLFYAYANNDLGQIVGYGCQSDTCGVVRLDMAGAVPEPAAAWLWLAGFPALYGWHRRKKTAVPCGYGGFLKAQR